MSPGALYVVRELPRYGRREIWSEKPWRLAVAVAQAFKQDTDKRQKELEDRLRPIAETEEGKPVPRTEIVLKNTVLEIFTVEVV